MACKIHSGKSRQIPAEWRSIAKNRRLSTGGDEKYITNEPRGAALDATRGSFVIFVVRRGTLREWIKRSIIMSF